MKTPAFERSLPPREIIAGAWHVQRDPYDTDIITRLDFDRLDKIEAMRIAAKELFQHGYTIFDNNQVGIDSNLIDALNNVFDAPDIVKRHDGDTPSNRRRARDVICWEKSSEHLEGFVLSAYPTVTITDEKIDLNDDGGFTIKYGEREVSRFNSLEKDSLASFYATLLSIFPSSVIHNGVVKATELQASAGTLSVNAFETYDKVVNNLLHHDDNTRFIALTVVDVRGEGAESLLQDEITGEIILDQQIQPGQTLVFSNDTFLHGARPLIGENTRRRVLVTTLDVYDTYRLVHS